MYGGRIDKENHREGGKQVARVSGVDLPKNKPVWIALTYIYGIGPTNTYDIPAGKMLLITNGKPIS